MSLLVSPLDVLGKYQWGREKAGLEKEPGGMYSWEEEGVGEGGGGGGGIFFQDLHFLFFIKKEWKVNTCLMFDDTYVHGFDQVYCMEYAFNVQINEVTLCTQFCPKISAGEGPHLVHLVIGSKKQRHSQGSLKKNKIRTQVIYSLILHPWQGFKVGHLLHPLSCHALKASSKILYTCNTWIIQHLVECSDETGLMFQTVRVQRERCVDLRQEIQKCFWSQIQVMKINKSNSTVTAMAKLQTGGDLKLLLAGQPMKMSEWHQHQ